MFASSTTLCAVAHVGRGDDMLLAASGSFDGLAHEPQRHGVLLVRVVPLDAPAGSEALAAWTLHTR
jgi:hypothetical protein